MVQVAATQSDLDSEGEPREAAGTANRRHQMFPLLSPQEIDRIRRFGKVLHYQRGDRLFADGQPGPGMFVVLKAWWQSPSATAWATSCPSCGRATRISGRGGATVGPHGAG